MDSTIISCIDAILPDLEVRETETSYFEKLRNKLVYWLRNLKIFVLCARKLSNDASLGSFLARIEDTVRVFAEEIHLQAIHEYSYSGESIHYLFDKVQGELESLEEEVDKWYVTLLDHQQDSTSLTIDQVLEIITHIAEDLMGSECVSKLSYRTILREAMEDLREQLRFLSCLIWLTTQTSVEPTQDLLAHSQIVALEAASLFSAFRVDLSAFIRPSVGIEKASRREMHLKISTLAEKIKPIHPPVYEVYTQVLGGSKMLLPPTEDMDNKVTSAREVVLNTLISNLWEILLLDTTSAVFMKDHLKEIYEGLRSLRNILNQQPDKFDSKIGAVLCDAAVFIWSLLYQTNPEVDLGLGPQYLLQTINNILAEVGQQDPQIPKFDFPGTDELGFLDLLLEKLMAFTTSKAEIIQQELVFLRPFAGEIVELCSGQEEFQALWDRVLAAVNKIEGLIEPPVVGDLPDSLSTSFDSVIKDIMEIKADVFNTFYGKSQEIDQVKEATSTNNQMPSQRTPSTVNEVVGFEDEARSTMERLTRGSRSLRIIAIVGMAGSGKTTIATKVFNDTSIMYHFGVRAWCTVSQTLNKKKVLLDLLSRIDPMSSSDHDMAEQDLAEKLRRSLKGRRYLIFLDDVWDINAWNRLTDGLLFPDDSVGSRIILTSRYSNAAPRHMLDQEPHFLRQLGKEESLELLQKKLLPQNGWPLEVHDILVQIAEICKGLPLSIVIVAGLLATTEPGGWKEILDDLSLGLGSITERCKNTLELSYKNLPNDLRSCLLYFGVFQEDEEVSVRKLIRLWIAEGFVQKTHEVKNLEVAAEDYVKDLIGRSLVMVAKYKSDGRVKTCRVHDLLHDFCLEKAKNEHFFHFLRGQDELLAFSEPSNLRRLCIRSAAEDFKRSQLFCPGALSLLFNCSPNAWESDEEPEDLLNITFVIHAFKLLKVLDLQQISIVSGFPDEIALLVQLAFLAIGGTIEHIPSSIDYLSNLETLILDTTAYKFLLPGSLWNLQKLQYLYIPSYICKNSNLPIENLDSSPILYELDTFSGTAIPSSSLGRLLKKFPNIRKLKCRLLCSGKDTAAYEEDTVVVVDFESQLESLHISCDEYYIDVYEFSFPKTLKKLSLSLNLSSRSISMIGKLPTLQVLIFKCVKFEEDTWEVKEGEFQKLEFLKLYLMDGPKWTACDDQFGCLKKLVLKLIDGFKETPLCFESIPTLEMIDVYQCTPNVIKMVRQIEEQQLMWGNSSLKIKIVGESD